jgi:hypothetical protein
MLPLGQQQPNPNQGRGADSMEDVVPAQRHTSESTVTSSLHRHTSAPIAGISPTIARFCSNCGVPNNSGGKFCAQCGRNLEGHGL